MSLESAGVPLPVRMLLEQEVDEDCAVFLEYDAFETGENYTTAKIIADSNITSAEYTITDSFEVPCKNITELVGETTQTTGSPRLLLRERTANELAALFNMVSISYSIDKDSTEIDSTN